MRSSHSSLEIPSDVVLLAIVDDSCTRSPASQLWNFVELDKSESSGDFGQSVHKLSFPNSVKYHWLKTELDKEPCILGIANGSEDLHVANISATPDWKQEINVPARAEFDTGKYNVTVAVIDSGIDLKSSRFELASPLTGANRYDFDSNPQDDTGHGTRVSSLIAAEWDASGVFGGVAAGVAKIFPVKLLKNDRFRKKNPSKDLFDAIRHSVNVGADVVHMSITGYSEGCDPIVGHAIYKAIEKGVFFVFSAGNGVKIDANKQPVPDRLISPEDDSPADLSSTAYPACWGKYFKGALAVASTTSGKKEVAYHSNHGSAIEISAPGTNIPSIALDNVLIPTTGTSVSAPQVTGAIALLISHFKKKQWAYSPWLIEDVFLNAMPQYPEIRVDKGRFLDIEALASYVRALGNKTESERREEKTNNPRDGKGHKPDEIGDRAQRVEIFAQGEYKIVDSTNDPVVFVPSGTQIQFGAAAYFLQKDPIDITNQAFWSTNNSENCPIDQGGNTVFRGSDGTRCRLIAHFEGKSATMDAEITNPPPVVISLQSVEIELPPKFSAGESSVAFKAIGSYSDNTKKDITKLGQWTSSVPNELIPNPNPGSFNTESAIGNKSYTVSFSLEGIDQQITAQMDPVPVKKYAIENRLGARIFRGQMVTLRTLLEIDTVEPFLVESHWTVKDNTFPIDAKPAGVQTINTANIALGRHIIRAEFLFKGNTPPIPVNAEIAIEIVERIERLEVLTKTTLINNNQKAQFEGRAYFPNNSYQVVTTKTEWASSDPARLKIDNQGVVYPGKDVSGEFTITGKYEGKTATAKIRVVDISPVTGADSPLASVEVISPRLLKWGSSLYFKAIGHYEDGSIRDITHAATWATSGGQNFYCLSGGSSGTCVISVHGFGGAEYDLTVLYEGKTSTLKIVSPKTQIVSKTVRLSPGAEVTQSKTIITSISLELLDPEGQKYYVILPGTFTPVPALNTAAAFRDSYSLGTTNIPFGSYHIDYIGIFRGNGTEDKIEERISFNVIAPRIVKLTLVGRDIEQLKDGSLPRVLHEHYQNSSITPVIEFSNGQRRALRQEEVRWSITDLQDKPLPNAGLYPIGSSVKPLTFGTQIERNFKVTAKHATENFQDSASFRSVGVADYDPGALVANPPKSAPKTPKEGSYCTEDKKNLDGFPEGLGTKGNPFLICSAPQLINLLEFWKNEQSKNYREIRDSRPQECQGKGTYKVSRNCSVSYFRLMDNIDLSSYANLAPVPLPRSSIVDGNGFEIQNATIIDSEANQRGLFTGERAVVNDALFHDLGLRNITVRGKGGVGTLTGYAQDTILRRCYLTGGQVQGERSIGGLIGHGAAVEFYDTIVEDTTISLEKEKAGGFVGNATSYGVRIIDSSAINMKLQTVGVQGGVHAVGGLVGRGSGIYWLNPTDEFLDPKLDGPDIRFRSVIMNSRFEGEISAGHHVRRGESDTGGLVGRGSIALINNEVEADIFATGDNVGGLVGENTGRRYSYQGLMIRNKFEGSVIGRKSVGGLAGFNVGGMVFENTVRGKVKGVESVGGIFGTALYYLNVKNNHSFTEVSTPSQKHGGFLGNYRNYTFQLLPNINFTPLSEFQENTWDANLSPDVNSVWKHQGKTNISIDGIRP